MISNIHSTTIVVSDQDKALDFYVNILGWEVAMDSQMSPAMRWLTVVPLGATTQLVLGHPSWTGESKTPDGYTGICVATPDIEATFATLTERGVKFKGPVEEMPWGGKATWFSDPDGNQFFLAGE